MKTVGQHLAILRKHITNRAFISPDASLTEKQSVDYIVALENFIMVNHGEDVVIQIQQEETDIPIR